MKHGEIISELEKIRAMESDGVLRAECVVEVASNPGHPLHGHFEWDDSAAAQQWRLQQARQMINVLVQFVPHVEANHRVYVSLYRDRAEEGGGYRVISEVLSNKQLRNEMLEEALAELKDFEQKYRSLQELADVFAAARKARRETLIPVG